MMCKLCERASRYRNDNKYFGFTANRHLCRFGDKIMELALVREKRYPNKKRFNSWHINRSWGGWPRKGNGVAQWDKEYNTLNLT